MRGVYRSWAGPYVRVHSLLLAIRYVKKNIFADNPVIHTSTYRCKINYQYTWCCCCCCWYLPNSRIFFTLLFYLGLFAASCQEHEQVPSKPPFIYQGNSGSWFPYTFFFSGHTTHMTANSDSDFGWKNFSTRRCWYFVKRLHGSASSGLSLQRWYWNIGSGCWLHPSSVSVK